MGYDMYHEEKPGSEVAAYDQAHARFMAAVAKRDSFPRDTPEHDAVQPEVDAAYEAMGKAEAYYFRLNIFGMERYRAAMAELGMLDSLTRGPRQNDWDQASLGSEARQEKAYEKLRTRTAEHPTGLPRYKFGSNDGWLITPEEIKAALARYERPGAGFFAAHEIDEDYWDEWIHFLEQAVERGGFRVY